MAIRKRIPRDEEEFDLLLQIGNTSDLKTVIARAWFDIIKFMEEFDDDDINLNAPLDIRYVIVGLAMLISGLICIALVENQWVKYVGFACLILSVFVMTKKDKRNSPK